jgi:hypothetical protein
VILRLAFFLAADPTKVDKDLTHLAKCQVR